MPKPERKQVRTVYLATHREHFSGQWQTFNDLTETWDDTDYDDVPYDIWRSHVKRRDGYSYYTDRKHSVPAPD